MNQYMNGAVAEPAIRSGPLRALGRPLAAAASALAGVSAWWELAARMLLRWRFHASPVRERRGRV
jgi:hypothetical protein